MRGGAGADDDGLVAVGGVGGDDELVEDAAVAGFPAGGLDEGGGLDGEVFAAGEEPVGAVEDGVPVVGVGGVAGAAADDGDFVGEGFGVELFHGHHGTWLVGWCVVGVVGLVVASGWVRV